MFDDATLLLKEGRHASAFNLLGLAADELGKHIMVTAFPTRPGGKTARSKFRHRVRSHETKLRNARTVILVEEVVRMEHPSERLEGVLGERDFHDLRLRATYVNWGQCTSKVAEPSNAVASETVASFMKAVQAALELCESRFDFVSAEGLASIFRELDPVEDDSEPVDITVFAAARYAEKWGASREDAWRFGELVSEGFDRAEAELRELSPDATTMDLDDDRLAAIMLEVFSKTGDGDH